MSRFNHRVGHALQHCCVSARVNCGHGHVVDVGELLHCECFVKVLSLNIFPNSFVHDRSPVFFGGTEKHAGSVVVLIVYNVHLIVSEVILIFLLHLVFSPLKHNNLVLSFVHHFLVNLGLWGLLFSRLVKSPFA